MDVSPMTPEILLNASYETAMIDDRPVQYVEYGGHTSGPVFVLVHGLGGSHLNWDLLAPLLYERGTVFALDLPGFGRTEPGGRDCSVEANVSVLTTFLDEYVGESAILVGNSMGGMIAVLAAASAPHLIDGLVLLDPAAPLPGPGLGVLGALYAGATFWALERLLGASGALTPERKAKLTHKACGVDPEGLPAWFVDRTVALMGERQDVDAMDKAFFQAARSCTSLMVHPGIYRRAMDTVTVPVLLLHGDRDKLVSVRSARDVAKRNPDWTYVELRGVGHCPMVEVPQRTYDEITAWALLEGIA